jgi:alpha/beta superfamily hydrolase
MPEVVFNGPEGRLEGHYTHSKTPNAPLALILHPHPEHGGTMNNKVTYAMFQTMVARGFSTLRFNFRGVGKSQGEHDKGEGELSDAASALDWMQELNPNAPYTWIAGFSFGSWIGMQLLMRRPEVQGFVSVAPPAHTNDFTFLAPCPTSGLIIRGAQDEFVPQDSIVKLIDRLHMQKGIHVEHKEIDGANHFFRNKLGTLSNVIHDYMNEAGAGRTIIQDQKEAA